MPQMIMHNHKLYHMDSSGKVLPYEDYIADQLQKEADGAISELHEKYSGQSHRNNTPLREEDCQCLFAGGYRGDRVPKTPRPDMVPAMAKADAGGKSSCLLWVLAGIIVFGFLSFLWF